MEADASEEALSRAHTGVLDKTALPAPPYQPAIPSTRASDVIAAQGSDPTPFTPRL